MRTPVRIAVPVAAALPLALLFASPTLAAGKSHPRTADTTAPTIAISSPTTGSTTASSLTVAGTSSDNVGVAAVTLQLDGGTWQAATGTTSWSVPLSGLTSGTHTVTARATDAAGNARPTTNSFTVSAPAPSPSPTPTPPSSPSPSPSPSPTTSPSASPTPSPTSTTSTGSAPSTQGTWTSPEGAVISVSTAGSWTIAQVYRLLLDASSAPGDFARVAPHLQVNVQDTYASQTSTGASGAPGNYTNYVAAIYLKGNSGNFVATPEATITHEYGHAWNLMHLYLDHGGDWSPYLGKRWSSSDGSVLLGQDSRLNSGYSWDPNEIMADDYRMLFGNAAAVSEWPNHLNTSIVDPRQQPGLKDWFLSTWR